MSSRRSRRQAVNNPAPRNGATRVRNLDLARLRQELGVAIGNGGTDEEFLARVLALVVRFIFPFEPVEASAIQFLFTSLFVRSITLLVAGEDEIWMVESGQNDRVHVWKAKDANLDQE